MIQHEIFSVVSRFPRYILCYKAESRFPLGQCIMIRYFLLSIISDFSCSTFITCFMILILTYNSFSVPKSKNNHICYVEHVCDSIEFNFHPATHAYFCGPHAQCTSRPVLFYRRPLNVPMPCFATSVH